MPATHLDSAILGMGGGAPVPATTLMRNEALLKAGALQSAIFNSANFALIATDEKGIIQLFNIGAERMLGYAAAEVVDKISPAHFSDAQEVIARAVVLSREFATAIAPGFEALALIERAVALAGPYAQIALETREIIVQRRASRH